MKDKISLGNTKDLTKKRKRLQQEPRKAKESSKPSKKQKGSSHKQPSRPLHRVERQN